MQGFQPGEGMLSSQLEAAERGVLARLFADTAELLGTDLGIEPAQTQTGPLGEEELLAALDFEPGQGPEPPEDPALARLLPPMTADPALAAELRRLTEDSLRTGKVERLRLVWSELVEPSGAQGEVVVELGQEQAWLAAITDVRLVLAARLEVGDAEDAERVYARARLTEQPPGEGRGRDAEVGDALATMYAALTWWQESLLEALPYVHGRR